MNTPAADKSPDLPRFYYRISRVSRQRHSETVAAYARSITELMEEIQRISDSGDSCRILNMSYNPAQQP